MIQNNDRNSVITISGKDYELILTTLATKSIAKKYGGLENLGDKLMKSENFESSLDEVISLIVLLANQSIMIHNLRNKATPEPLLTADEVELLTSPSEFITYKDAITACMVKGTKRNVESEDDHSKNAQGQI